MSTRVACVEYDSAPKEIYLAEGPSTLDNFFIIEENRESSASFNPDKSPLTKRE
jgi:hypothetical protein